jgi:patatin-like phospholipase/acyl hydrolase
LRAGEARPHLLIFSYNLLIRQALVFKNDGREEFASFPIWEAVKASCSAPTYFPAHLASLYGTRAPLIDGGVVANNPCGCALAEGLALQQKKAERSGRVSLGQFIVASFGTGELTRPISIAEAREWGALEWVVPIIDVLFDGAADAVDYIARQLLPRKHSYYRFQTRLDKAYDDMDNASATNINALESVAWAYLNDRGGKERLRRLAAKL